MTLSTALKQTDDIQVEAVTSLFVQQAETGDAILTDYFDEEPTIPTQVFQTTSVQGDDFDYLLSFDAQQGISVGVSGTTIVRLNTWHVVINATNATLLPAQDETDYDDTGSNGDFYGGTGYAVSDTMTLDCDSVLTVDAVSGGVVTQFSVTTPATGEDFIIDNIRRVVSTSGSGVDFTLFPALNNMVDFLNAFVSAAAVISYSFSVITGQDQLRNTFTFQENFASGSQYNFGSFVFKTRQSDAGSFLTGTIAFQLMHYTKVKR